MSVERTPDPLHAALRSAGGLVWGHLPSVVAVSLAWFLASLPVVTAGPATVGAYAAVRSLREEGRLDVRAVGATVRRQFGHAVLLGLLPAVLAFVAANYALAYLATGATPAGLLALVTGYGALYVWLLLVPTFVGLAAGERVTAALARGYAWTAHNPVPALALGVVTAAVLAATAVLTVAVPLLFAGVACAVHVELVAETTAEPTDDHSTRTMRRPHTPHRQ